MQIVNGYATTNQLILISPYQPHGEAPWSWIRQTRPGNWATVATLRISMPELETYAVWTAPPLPHQMADPKHKVRFTATPPLSLRNGLLSIVPGWEFDGASGPAITATTNLLAALIHDALWELIRTGDGNAPSFAISDTIYRRVMLAQGSTYTRAWAHWAAIRSMGWAWRLTAGRAGRTA